MPARRPAEHFQTIAQQERILRFGMWTFLGSEALLFAGLFALYAGYHAEYGEQFVVASRYSVIWAGTVNTYVLITSSLTVALGVGAARADRPRTTAGLLVVSILLGLLFLGLKAVEYTGHLHEGIAPGRYYQFHEMDTAGARTYFTLYYLMTGLHALHVVAGLVVLAWLATRAFRRRYSSSRHVGLELGALYWHLVDLIWIFLWPLFYRIST